MSTRKSILIILDGFGIGKHDHSDAVWEANTPFTDSLTATMPHTRLLTHGEHVGLPDGQMGNSEVGHMNIGAGRVVWQMLVRINKSIREGELARHPMLLETMQRVKKEGKAIHFLGLLGDGGVHASSEHLFALCNIAKEQGLERVYIHAFLDGRDTDPRSGEGFLEELYRRIEDTPAKLASLIGRYYAMDRDKRWERVKKAYDLLVHGQGLHTDNLLASVRQHYSQNITDEFMEPLVVVEHGKPLATIQPGDAVVFFNFRTDRGRQLTQVLSQQDMPEFGMHTLPLDYLTFTSYDHSYRNVKVLFEDQNLNHTLGQVISDAGLKQLRAAETEKYPHVTFFFSGGREAEFPGEFRVLAASPKVATYDLQPEMSAFELRDMVLERIRNQSFDFACINFANPDMVGHTGVYPAIVKAVETVDQCAQALVEEGLKHGYDFLIIADHGNADFAVNADGTPNTAHSMNPVPCWLVSNDLKPTLREGILADVAPTILKMMHLTQPAEMSGVSLF
jgi:2,3-bisphosphoglycerate-independent phosphoglycerate mutase